MKITKIDNLGEPEIICSTWQSIYEMPKKYFAQFDFIIGDEAHTFKAKSLTAIMTKLINCDVRIGTTGTLDDSKVNKLVLEGLFGPTFKVISTKELIERKQLANFNIKCLVLKYPEAVCKTVKGFTYQDEMNFLTQHEGRNNFIRDLAINLKGNTLILFTYVDKHGRILFDLIREKVDNNRKIFFVHGGTEAEDREAVRQITDDTRSGVKLTFDEGVILLPEDLEVPLNNGKAKRAKFITVEDDIQDAWLKSNFYKYLYK